MAIRFTKTVTLLFLIMAIMPTAIRAGEDNSKKCIDYISNKLLVKFYPEVTDEKKTTIRKELGVELVKCLKEIGVEVWKLPSSLSVDDAINKLNNESSVEYTEPDCRYKPKSIPHNSKLIKIWRMINTGVAEANAASTTSEGSSILSDDGGGFFISTAVYGSYDHPDVVLLRNVRDMYISKFDLGRRFISVYYHISPPLARLIRGHEIVRYISRVVFFPIVTFSMILTGFGLKITAIVATIGYFLPFTLFFIMAREKRDDDF